jgi:D-arabinose 1-dehydrogenase-like Zn-dependent alcohol dehydrogenase
LKFSGSAIGSPNEIEQMLKLASKENIVANTQVWPLEKVNEAIAAFREGKPRYRFVLQVKQ